ncbi:MAG: hypothetical protein GTN36_00525 [Candidatus Aenigmarchaeota archaeon]|nr:hypothetical protein [Candidatus Aenigmarchaeota archaeon]
MAVDLVWLGLVLLFAPVLGAYAKLVKDKRGFIWLTGAGALYLLAAAFTVEIEWIPSGLQYGNMIFSVIALIATFIGALMVAVSVFK